MSSAKDVKAISASYSLSKVSQSTNLTKVPPPTKAQRTQWKPKQLVVIDILANGRRLKPGGAKLTVKEIAAKAGSTRATVYKWIELPGFRQAVADRMVQFTEDRLPSIVHAMCDAAEDGKDVKAAKFIHGDVLKKGTSDLSDLNVFEALYLRLGVSPTSIPDKD